MGAVHVSSVTPFQVGSEQLGTGGALGQDSATRGDRTEGFITCLLQLIGFFGPVCILT